MNNYLIPANSKKSMLIFGLFNKTDLWIFLIGVFSTILLLLILPVEELVFAIIAISPGLICGFLVLPVPNYHNVMGFLKSMFNYISSRKQYYWKGWCVKDAYGRNYEGRR